MTIGVLPLNVLKSLMYSNTGFFETSQIDIDEAWKITVGNYDGAGISQGPSQMNFDFGDPLSLILRAVYNNHRDTWDSVFALYPAYEQALYDAIFVLSQAAKIAWADSISYVDASQEKRGLDEPWIPIFQAFSMQQDYRDEYVNVVNVQYYPRVEKLFRSMPCTSRMSFASFYDLSVNRGRYYPILDLLADFDAIDANTGIDETEKERQKIYQINHHANGFENGIGDPTVYDDRRYCMANQGGNYFGTMYEPDVHFDMNQEPALAEKADFIKGIKNISFGETKITKVNLGVQPIFEEPFYTSEAPDTQFRTAYNDWQGMANQSAVSLTAGEKLWIDVQNWLGTRLYYTTDGSTPTTSSQRYTGFLTFNESVTLKTLAVSVYGIAEAVKTLAVTVAAASVTSISPSAVTQNTIPITVTLTNNQGNTIYYKVGTGTQQTYTGPFSVNQSTAGVQSTNILVTYWSTGEAEKSITYNTSGAIPAKPSPIATAGNNQVALSWAATANTTSYTVYRSTVQGQLGSVLLPSQWQTGTSYTDTTAVNGQTYYYTVQAGNYGSPTNSDQVTATPIAAPSGWRYLKILGYGAAELNQEVTTRIIEFEAWEGATNRMTAANILSGEAPSNAASGGTHAQIKNGTKASTSNTYPFWWTATPNANIVVDLLAERALTKLNYYGYSLADPQRTNRFKILASNTNNGADWVTIWDNQTGQEGLQPILPNGYEKIL